MDAIRLAAQWAPGPVDIESDCVRIVRAIQQGDIPDIGLSKRDLKTEVEWKVVLVNRK